MADAVDVPRAKRGPGAVRSALRGRLLTGRVPAGLRAWSVRLLRPRVCGGFSGRLAHFLLSSGVQISHGYPAACSQPSTGERQEATSLSESCFRS